MVDSTIKKIKTPYQRLYFLMYSKDIAGYMVKTLKYWLIPIEYVMKSPHHSWYIKLHWGTANDPKSVHIRISDHDTVSESSRYEYDVLCSVRRSGSHGINPVTYIQLIELLAEKFGKDIPPLCKALRPFRKQHSITLQQNRKNRSMAYPGHSRLFIA